MLLQSWGETMTLDELFKYTDEMVSLLGMGKKGEIVIEYEALMAFRIMHREIGDKMEKLRKAENH